jgi:DNA-binding GntR family transcriptional regulator
MMKSSSIGRQETSAATHMTKAEIALRFLRERLRTGELAPGQHLYIQGLTGELQMSPTPIREALRVLQADGMVEYEPHRGVVVAEIGPGTLDEICRLRQILEPLAVEWAVEKMSTSQVADLEKLHGRLIAAAGSARSANLAELNRRWHHTLYGVSDSRYLTDFLLKLWEGFPWRTMWALPDRRAKSVAEHETVMVALRKRDKEQAAHAMRIHLSSSENTLMPQLQPSQTGRVPPTGREHPQLLVRRS